jgi:hypothetical protein
MLHLHYISLNSLYRKIFILLVITSYYMNLVITYHAKQRMDQNGITEDQILLAIQRGAKTPQTDGFIAAYTYIRVAYKIKGGKYIIKTVMVER